ncbi:MAG: hypothetical protein HN396_18150 [Gemmatimonadales bacterium]|jgi:hypothetical protein|nr:hypothetical protein [Gemmatimonadales bacterium]
MDPLARKAMDRERNLRRVHGLSVDEYAGLLVAQGGVCAVCGELEKSVLHGEVKRMAVDHDHVSGEIRGLLCSRCNTALGLLNDDVDILAMAQVYLLLPIQNPIQEIRSVLAAM